MPSYFPFSLKVINMPFFIRPYFKKVLGAKN